MNQDKNTTTLALDSATAAVTSRDSAKQPDTKLHKSGTESNSSSDSDTTIIYEVPPCTKPKKVVTFETVTHGIKITKKSRMYKCPVCGIKKTSIQSINEHYHRWHKKVQCKICNKQFNNPSSRDKHMYVHQSWNRFQCSQCDKEFPFKFMLDDHKGQHMMAKCFPCWWPGCKHGFTYRWDLKKHITAHKNVNKQKKCKYCDYTNADPQNLKQHTHTHMMKSHTNVNSVAKVSDSGYRKNDIRMMHVQKSLKKFLGILLQTALKDTVYGN